VSSYLDWNDGLAQHFFQPEVAGQTVWLYVTDDLIAQLGNRIGVGAAEFVAAVKAGPEWVTARGLCQRALQAAEDWRDRELRYPPYIGYLGLFVLAAGLEGDFAPHAYYPRLRTLLGDASSDALPSFDRMLELWDDLERWSAHDRSGELGLFEARIVGGHIHIGLPIAQTILSEHERGALPHMFAEAGLDPTSPPPDDELARILRAQGGNVLRPRTRELVRTRRDPEGYAALIDAVAEELAAWDGSYDDELSAEGTPRERRFGSLRLCVAFDRVSGRLSASLRCRVKREFPDGGLVLKSRELPALRCSEAGVPGWSSPLADVDTQEAFDAATLDWSEALSLNDERLGWRFGLPRRRVRVLVQGVGEGLGDLVEVGQVPRAQSVYLLYQDADWPQLAEWAEHECRDFRTHPVREGMRPGWQLASCSEVTGDERVRSTFPELVLSERVRLVLVGGVRRDRGPNFFPFALPSVLLEGGDGRETVVCNGRALAPAQVPRSYALPEGLPRESRITLEAVRDGEVLKRVSIYVTGEFEWRQATPEQVSNEWGGPSTENGAGVAGALMIGRSADPGEFERPVMFTPGVERSAPRVLLIGRIPGQICSWPVEPQAAEWRPIWAVSMGRRGRAVYCGSDIEAAAPAPGQSGADRHQVELWKKTLWHRRMRIRAPEEPALAALWRSYVEAARLV
jgi:hypothetical protein